MGLGLPELDGIQAAATIKAIPECRHFPIVAVTDYFELRKNWPPNFIDFVNKPIHFEKPHSVISAHLARWEGPTITNDTGLSNGN